MITPAYALTATERVLPRLALDFTSGVLDSRVTITRALNTATRVNSSGYIEIINANLPRFDYSPVTFAPLGLLIEETRTNILLRSEEFNLASWTKIRSSVTPDAILSPAGIVNADKLIEDTTATSSHFMLQIPAASASTTYTYSVYLQAAERNRAMLEDGGGSNAQAYFDLLNGTVISTSAGATATIRNAGNGFYRCAMTFTTAVGQTGINARIYLINTGTNISYTGDGTSGIYIYGAQIEAGAFATSYIPTTTTSLTRNGDQASMTGANFTSWFIAGPGTLYTQASQPVIYAGSRSAASLCTSANNPRISNYRQSAGGINGYAINSAGVGNAGGSGVVATSNSRQSTITSYTATNSQIVSANASAIATIAIDMSTSLSAFTGLAIGNDFLGANTQFCGHIQKVMWWPLKMTNAEAQAFSK